MKYCFTDARQTGSGRWKLYAIGQPATHIMDWRGPNFRQMSLPDQPARGFATAEEAVAFANATYVDELVRAWAGRRGDGSSLREAESKSPRLKRFVGPLRPRELPGCSDSWDRRAEWLARTA